MKLSEEQLMYILDNKLIDSCTEDEKQQVFNFAFGEEFMNQLDDTKGTLQTYEVNHDCWENAQPYEFEEDGHRFHGWECGICGEFLQSG